MTSTGLRDFTHIKPAAAPAPPRSLLREARNFSATVVVVFVFATTALSLYDLYLFVTLMLR